MRLTYRTAYVVLVFDRRVYILVDARRGIQDSDVDMMFALNEAFIPYQVHYTHIIFAYICNMTTYAWTLAVSLVYADTVHEG